MIYIIELINEGISIIDNKVVLNTNVDSENDIMNIVYPDIYNSTFLNNVYYFGYKFNDKASRKDRTIIIHWLKGLDKNNIDNESLKKFIDKPIAYLNKEIDLSTLSAIIYPRSNRSNLTLQINREISLFTQHYTDKISYELIKNIPNNITFDWNLFNYNYEGDIGDNQYNQIYNYIETVLMPKIHNLSYFSIADSVKPKYRKYIQNYLMFENKETENALKAIQAGKLLVIDDINTSGSTLTEILRLVKAINNDCEIYIFTLIGK